MSAVSKYVNPYTGSINFSKRTSNIYVHLRGEHVGAAYNSKVTMGDQTSLINQFNDAKANAFQASMNQFQNLFFESLSRDGKDLLRQTFQVYNSDTRSVMDDIQRKMKKQLSDSLNTQKLQNLIDIIQDKGNQKTLSQVGMILQETNIERYASQLANFFNMIETCANLIQDKIGFLPAVFKDEKQLSASFSTGKELGEALQEALKNFSGVPLHKKEKAQFDQVIHSINALAHGWKTGKKMREDDEDDDGKSERNLTVKGVQIILRNIFSTGFGEALAGSICYGAKSTVRELILTGLKTYNVTYWDENGQISMGPSYSHSFNPKNTEVFGDQSRAGKADVFFKGARINIGTQQSPNEIKMNFGISVKTYKDLKFNKKAGKWTSGTISSGAGPTFLQAIYNTFGTDAKYKYYAYNILTHQDRYPQALQVMQDAILTRNILRLFSSRGNGDFAQFLYINGQIISIWEIILSTQTSFLGISRSQIRGRHNQVAALTIPDRPKAVAVSKEQTKYINTRVQNANKALERLRLYAILYLKNIKLMQ